MPSIKAVKAENAKFSLTYLPVAIFVGGTSGVGQGLAQAFAKHAGGNAHIIIVGRNKQAAESIIATFPKPSNPEAKHEFIQSDVSLMSNVHETTSQLLSRLPKINFLIMTPGIMSLNGRNETSEGIDQKLALHHYARFAFTYDLLPLVKKADEQGEAAKIYSVLAAGDGGEVNADDFGLKKTYTFQTSVREGISYMDLAFKEFAVRNPSSTLTFSHSYPGIVATALLKSSDTPTLRFVNKWLMPLAAKFMLTLENAGEYQLYGMLNYTGGFQRVGASGENIGMKNFFGEDEELRKKFWAHSLAECRIEAKE